MESNTDDKFFERADAFIHLANTQCVDIGHGKVSASMMYAAARFNAFVSASGFETGAEMAQAQAEMIEYFTAQYRAMLEENIADYVANFDPYMK